MVEESDESCELSGERNILYFLLYVVIDDTCNSNKVATLLRINIYCVIFQKWMITSSIVHRRISLQKFKTE